MAETKKTTTPIMDVAHPNKSAPSPNSKSVIISHHPVMQDPMVSSDTTTESSETPASPAKKINLQPLSAPLVPGSNPTEEPVENITEEPAENLNSVPTPVEKKIIKPVSISDSEPKQESTEKPSPPNPVKSEASTQESFNDRSDEGPVTPEALVDAAVAEQAKADAEVQKLIDSKKYSLPINTLENRRTKRTIILGILVSLLLVAAWLNISLDAGLLTIEGIKPLTDFF